MSVTTVLILAGVALALSLLALVLLVRRDVSGARRRIEGIFRRPPRPPRPPGDEHYYRPYWLR
jgi:hypothetical protein